MFATVSEQRAKRLERFASVPLCMNAPGMDAQQGNGFGVNEAFRFTESYA